jgi:serine/threonine protein kinase/WD40 repeat protein
MPPGLLEGLKALHPTSDPTVNTMELSSGTPSPEPGPVHHHGFLTSSEQPDEIGRFAGYRVLRELGAGGMGIVFLGEDPRLRRLVALKVMSPTLASDPLARERFEREARAMAAVEHDHIVAIYQVGEDRGVPFLAMPLLKGETLEARMRREPSLPLSEVLRIGREVAEGLAAAHARGLIHRDVKPGNLWLEAPSSPLSPGAREARGAGGRVKVLDFGLARATGEGRGITREGMIVGTPAYMSPEQANGLAAGPQSDLFSLGCVLYRLATGRLPFQGDNLLGILSAILNTEPIPPRQLNLQLPRQLNDLILRLLAKGPEKRPPSAQAVGDALAAIEATLAARPSRARRRRMAAVVLLLLGLIGGGLLAHEIIIRIKGKDGKTTEVRIDGDALVQVEKDGTTITVRTDTQPKPPPTITAKPPPMTQQASPPQTERPVPPPTQRPKPPSTERPKLPSTERAPVIVVRPPPTPPTGPSPFDTLNPELVPPYERRMAGAPVELVGVLGDSRLKCPRSPESLAFSPDGKRLAAGGYAADGSSGAVRVWSVQTGELVLSFDNIVTGVMCVRFSPDGKVLASTNADTVKLWNAETGKLIKELEGPSSIKGLSFSRDGKQLAAGGGGFGKPGVVMVFDLESGSRQERARHRDQVLSVCFSPDGKQLASGGGYHYDGGRGELVISDFLGQTRDVSAHTKEICCVAYSPDGKRLASAGASGDDTIKIWEPKPLKLVRSLTGHKAQIEEVHFSPDGKNLAGIDWNGKAIVWDVEKGIPLQTFQAMGFGKTICFSPDGTLLAVGGGHDREAIRIWDLASAKELFPPRGHTLPVVRLRIAPNRGQVISFTSWQTVPWKEYNDIVKCWDVATGRELQSSKVDSCGLRCLDRARAANDQAVERRAQRDLCGPAPSGHRPRQRPGVCPATDQLTEAVSHFRGRHGPWQLKE